MANRSFRPVQGSATQGVVSLYGEWAWNEDGTVNEELTSCFGFAPGPYDLSTGVCTLFSNQAYFEYLGMDITQTSSLFDPTGGTLIDPVSVYGMQVHPVPTKARWVVALRHVTVDGGTPSILTTGLSTWSFRGMLWFRLSATKRQGNN